MNTLATGAPRPIDVEAAGQPARPEAVAVGTNLGISIDGRRVLSGIDLRIRQGSLTALLGRNGAGKTTLLRILATLASPDTGTLELFGMPARIGSTHVRARIGYVGHQPMLYRDLSALENLVLFGRLYRLPDARERAMELLEAMGLADRATDRIRSLSRGMCQRVSVARSLLHDPDLLLADEPLTGLDERSAALVEERLRDLAERGKAVVTACHDADLALRLAGHVMVLCEGRMVLDGPLGTGSLHEIERALRVGA